MCARCAHAGHTLGTRCAHAGHTPEAVVIVPCGYEVTRSHSEHRCAHRRRQPDWRALLPPPVRAAHRSRTYTNAHTTVHEHTPAAHEPGDEAERVPTSCPRRRRRSHLARPFAMTTRIPCVRSALFTQRTMASPTSPPWRPKPWSPAPYSPTSPSLGSIGKDDLTIWQLDDPAFRGFPPTDSLEPKSPGPELIWRRAEDLDPKQVVADYEARLQRANQLVAEYNKEIDTVKEAATKAGEALLAAENGILHLHSARTAIRDYAILPPTDETAYHHTKYEERVLDNTNNMIEACNKEAAHQECLVRRLESRLHLLMLERFMKAGEAHNIRTACDSLRTDRTSPFGHLPPL